jgi:GDPmannose 4,6-dehydratase
VPSALITGVTGQDGGYLSELLAAKGYDVFGLVRWPSSLAAMEAVARVPSLSLLTGDLGDTDSLVAALDAARPDEVYNLGGVSFVDLPWRAAELTGDVTGMGVVRLLTAISVHTRGDVGSVRFYQASSSHMFGKVESSPQSESTPFHPTSAYAVAKTFAHHMTVHYRESYGAYACSGILFNHESPRRGHDFVTRKVSRGVARISLGLDTSLRLGDLDAQRDWGYAGDYVEAMHAMLQQTEPSDYVVATGVTHSIRDLLDVAFAHVGVDDWSGLVESDPRLLRPVDTDVLVGDASKARDLLGWKPKVGFEELIRMMVDADLQAERAGR